MADDTPRKGLLDPVKGFGVTFGAMFKKVTTEQYPEQKKGANLPIEPRFHGRHVLNRHPDGLEKCIGCELCAWACPADAIYVEGADNTEDARYSPGERYGRVYQINYLRCIFCGLCIEACPTRALTMSNEYELADTSRAALIYEKKDLLAPLEQGMLQPPHPMVPDTDEKDYYGGRVNGAVRAQVEWVEQHQPTDDVLDDVLDDGLGDGPGDAPADGRGRGLPSGSGDAAAAMRRPLGEVAR